MLNTTPNQLASATAENSNFGQEEQIKTTFAYYDAAKGTKYRKSNCALLIGISGAIGGYTVAALVDPATRNDILKGVGAGVAISMFYLWGSVSSLKPITERGILNIQTQIRHNLHSNLIEKTNINKNMENIAEKVKQIEPKAIEEHNELTKKAKEIFAAEKIAYNEEFNELAYWLRNYLAIQHIITTISYIYNDDNPNIEIPHATNCTLGSRSDRDHNNIDKYVTAASSLCVFVNYGSNDKDSQRALLGNLEKCLTKYNMHFIKQQLNSCPQPPRFHQPKGPNEKLCKNLKTKHQMLAYKASNLKDKIETLQKNHGIEVTNDGKIVFPSLQEFVASLPE